MYSDVFLTGTVQKIYEPADGICYAKIKCTKTIQTNAGPVTSYVNVLLKQKEGYEQYVGKMEERDLVFARGYLEVNEYGNPVVGTKGLPVFVLVPWTVRILGETVSESINDEFSVTVMGYLGKDPDMRYLQDGTAVTNISIASTRYFKSPNGESAKESTWWRVAWWRNQAETIANYCRKGSRLLVVGSINYDDQTHGPKVFERKDGTTGSSFEVTGLSFSLADSKGENGGSRHEQGVNPNNEFGSDGNSAPVEEDDSIPL